MTGQKIDMAGEGGQTDSCFSNCPAVRLCCPREWKGADMELQSDAKQFQGQVPAGCWVKQGEVGPIEGVSWAIFQHGDVNAAGWCNLKIAAQGMVPHKANYWIAWNGERFSASRDFNNAAQHRPDLVNAVSAFLLGDAA